MSSQISFIYGDLGLYEKGLEWAENALKISGTPLAEAKLLGSMAMIYNLLMLGEISRAGEIADAHKFYQQDLESFVYIPLGAPIYIQLLQKQGQLKQAIDLCEKLIVSLKKVNMNGFLPESLYTQSLLLMDKGQFDQAKKNLHKALRITETTGHRRIRWQVQHLLAELSNGKEADKLRGQARQEVMYIAEQIHASDMRSSFLNLPKVHSLIAMGKNPYSTIRTNTV